MKINLVKQDQRRSWNQFLLEKQGSFLQSWEWGDFQTLLSKSVLRLRTTENSQILAQALVIRETFPITKSCFYIPYGPVFKNQIPAEKRKLALNLIFKELKDRSSNQGAIFLRIEPQHSWPEDLPALPRRQAGGRQDLDLKSAVKRTQPQQTLIVDLTQSRSQILDNFESKTRYNARLGQRKGVQLRITKEQDRDLNQDCGDFYQLLLKTARRHHFKIYSDSYFKKLLKTESEDFRPELFLAQYQGQIIAAHLIIFFGKRATYLHGASSYKHRSVMAPHFLHWQEMLKAKDKGFEEFDFWGIDPKKWPGLTRFKKGFGGKVVKYPQAKELIFQPLWYGLYTWFREKSLSDIFK